MDRDEALNKVKSAGAPGLKALMDYIDFTIAAEHSHLEKAEDINNMFRVQGRIAGLRKLRSDLDAVRRQG